MIINPDFFTIMLMIISTVLNVPSPCQCHGGHAYNSASTNLKQNQAQSTPAESTHKGVNWCSNYVTQVQQQRPESPTVTLTWHVCKYKF